MKKYWSMLLLALMVSGRALACDVCNLYEFRPLDTKNYIGIFYRQSVFRGYSHLEQPHPFSLQHPNAKVNHEPGSESGYSIEKTAKDYEVYQTLELRLNLQLRPKVNLQAVLPYRFNTVYFNKVYDFPQPLKDSLLQTNGIGDLMLVTDYTHSTKTGKFKHLFRPGMGVRLPTGRYQQKSGNGAVYDAEIQAGTGAWAFLAKGSYTLLYKDALGLEQSLSKMWMDVADNEFRFGDQFNYSAAAFYIFRPKTWQVIPKAGIYYEQAKQSERYSLVDEKTGGRTLFAQASTDLIFPKFTVSGSFYLPVHEKLNGSQIGNAGRIQLGAFYNF